MKPISTLWPPYDWLWKMKLDLVINAPGARRLHPRGALSSSHGQHDDLMNHKLFKVLDDVHIFCLCLNVFQSQNPNIIMWYQC